MSSMEFWGVEVKAGEPLTVTLDDDFIVHLSHAALGESKKSKDTDSVVVSVTVDGKKVVLGTLSAENFPQLSFDLVFEKEFELSHNSKNASVYFTGYKSIIDDEGDEYDDFDSADELDIPMIENGKVEKPKVEAPKAQAAKPKTKPAEPAKPESESDDDDSDDSDDDDDEEVDSEDESGEDVSGEEMSVDDEDDDSDDSDEDSEEEEETPTPKKKPETGKKRTASDSAIKTPVPNKKAKQSTPQKTDGKKGGHGDTPHPVKKDGKPAAAKAKAVKSGGTVSCKSCEKKFVSEAAMESHAKAKHA